MKRLRGFSLIEMLVATAVMSMVLLISSMGYSYFMARWNKAGDKFSEVTQTAKKMYLTRTAIKGLFPYLLKDKNANVVLYFEGDKDGFVGVSGRSIFVEGSMAVTRLSVEQNTDFTYQLSYEEHVLDDVPFLRLEQTIEFEHKVVLLDELSDVQMTYFGAKDINAYSQGTKSTWWDSFNALSRRVMPEIIRINYIIDGIQYEFDYELSSIDQRIWALYENTQL